MRAAKVDANQPAIVAALRKAGAFVTLPWPPSVLLPNRKAHWATKARAAKEYRRACWVLAKEARLSVPAEGLIYLHLEFVPPDRRKRDDDGMVAAFKPGRDGLADALGVDDNRFRVRPTVAGRIGGMVNVRLEAGFDE